MPTSKPQLENIKTKLDQLGDFTCRPMMGEYLLYSRGVYIGGIYDAKILLKNNPDLAQYHLPEKVPYQNAKPMYLLEDLDGPLASEILNASYNYFVTHSPKKK